MDYERDEEYDDNDYSGRGRALREAHEDERDDENVSYPADEYVSYPVQQQHSSNDAGEETWEDDEQDPSLDLPDYSVNVASDYMMSGALPADSAGPVGPLSEEDLFVNHHPSNPEYFGNPADWFKVNAEALKAACPPPIIDYLTELDAKLEAGIDLDKEEWDTLQHYRGYRKDIWRRSIEEDTYRGFDDPTPGNESAGRARDRAGIDHSDHAYGSQRLRRRVHPEGEAVYDESDEDERVEATHYDYGGFN